MFVFLVLSAIVALSAASTEETFTIEPPVWSPNTTLNLGQFFPRLDHFRPQDNRTVQFNYVMNLDHYVTGGPHLIFINGGGVSYPNELIESGLMYDIAAEIGGALITYDLRYHGNNFPTENLSFENMDYLTVDQNVADIAVLITTLKQHLNSPISRVILWGSGVGGSLAALARKKFPHLVDGVWSSSGLFSANEIDTEYYEALSSIITSYGGEECAERVHNAFDVLEYLLENRESEYLTERFNLCEPLDVDNVQTISMLIHQFSRLISSYINKHHIVGLNNFCRDMNALPLDTLNSLIRWVSYAYGHPQCIDLNYDSYTKNLSDISLTSNAALSHRRQAYYALCTQVGGFAVTTASNTTLFPNRVAAEFHYKGCEDILGPNYNRFALAGATEAINVQYGAQFQVITHAIFTNGLLDPYASRGIQYYANVEATALRIDFAGASSDLSSISPYDSVAISNAKRTIKEHILRWSAGFQPRA